MGLSNKLKQGGQGVVKAYSPSTWRERGWKYVTMVLVITVLLIIFVLGIVWSVAPSEFDVDEVSKTYATTLYGEAQAQQKSNITGFTSTAALAHLVDLLLNKSGGYITNDISPPGIYLDNIKEWEFGVLVSVRDMARGIRDDFSRSQSQSAEDEDVIIAEPKFHTDNNFWIFPSTEGEYKDGYRALTRYLERLGDDDQSRAQFYARADNLREYLGKVEKRLGSLSQRLSASVGQSRINTDLAGDAGGTQSTPAPTDIEVKTSWWKIDNIFFEARGYSYGLLHQLKAMEKDFGPALEKKNARVSLRQIIRELEATQQSVWSPLIILNGGGFGLVTNYSLIMASYISRANAAVIDLRNLLEKG